MSQTANDRLMSQATLTASSTDVTSAQCQNNMCDVHQIANDGSGKENFDHTFWQSAPDARCMYGSLVPPPSVAQDQINTPVSPQFQFILIKNDTTTVDATSSLSCGSSTVMDGNDGTIVDTCTLSWANGIVGNVAGTAAGVQWIWTGINSQGTGVCQMNINELVLTGSDATTNGINPLDGSSSGVLGYLFGPGGLFGSSSSNSGPTLPTPPSQQGLPVWSIVLMIILAAVLGMVGTIIVMRRKNLKLRQNVRRLLAEERVGFRPENSAADSGYLNNSRRYEGI
ncbi:UNVERIFIED_CONTAM: hypothetical protein HDU68_008379 [Siphonaria sp. JEL0065]|nr:hypothetical protein HDU68_008379 [Siphonaria sp. JEL0065]